MLSWKWMAPISTTAMKIIAFSNGNFIRMALAGRHRKWPMALAPGITFLLFLTNQVPLPHPGKWQFHNNNNSRNSFNGTLWRMEMDTNSKRRRKSKSIRPLPMAELDLAMIKAKSWRWWWSVWAVWENRRWQFRQAIKICSPLYACFSIFSLFSNTS